MTDWYKIKRWLIRVNWVEKQFYPAGWNPWPNTLLYLPLNWDVKDYSGHSYTITTNSTLQYFTDYVLSNWIDVNIGTLQWNFTIMWYFKATSSNTYSYVFNQDYIAYGNYYWWYCDFNADGRTNVFRVSFLKQPAVEMFKNYYSTTVTNWHHYCMVVSNDTNVKYYLDWTQIYDLSISWWSKPSSHLRIMWTNNPASMSSWDVATYGWKIILENKARTAQEITNYYNLTKSTYGL